MKPSPLAVVFTRLRGRLGRLAGGITGSDEEAEDVLQDAFCRLWSAYGASLTYDDALRLGVTAVRNLAIDSTRRTSLRRMAGEEAIDTALPADDAPPAPDPWEMRRAVIEIARDNLGARQFEVFRLHDLEEQSYAEVAAATGLTEANVRMTLSRARKTIRDIYRNSQHNE